MNTTVSRRTAFRSVAVAGLAAAAGLFATSNAHAASDLVVLDQIGTGPWDQENCGPASAVIALVAADRSPDEYVSGAEGAAVGGNATVVMDMRAHCGLSPWGDPSAKSVDYWGAYLEDLEKGIQEYDGTATHAEYEEGVDAAASGSVVILHVHHGALIGEDADYGHFVVAQGKDSDGNILVSDPGRAQSIGITGYTRSHLLNARQGDATIVS
ncbi:hypothetical protein [Brachybacterium sacelli]|uniref:Peptidase C39-like domain-containing protein n=1 Tax=Brachybacterium sacelli TaxID=173364 RepID=A0ABS4WVX5_9MICO|nr:hypothetical protein [Brachybacterium sacelli]MBP2380298.1 hypothetical protein [Brachybacterium sacelli]